MVSLQISTEQKQLTAFITYTQPQFEELKRRFPAYVNPKYNFRWFEPIERCMSVSKESREIVFEYFRVDGTTSTDVVLAEMDRRGLRPALYEELLGFAEKYPDELRKFPIVALGSETFLLGQSCAASLGSYGSGPNLHLPCFDDDWRHDYRFLAVRK